MSSTPEGMTSNRPYLLRALYEWINDNGLTPHVLIDAECDGVDVPDHAIQKGKVVLNVAAGAGQKDRDPADDRADRGHAHGERHGEEPRLAGQPARRPEADHAESQ